MRTSKACLAVLMVVLAGCGSSADDQPRSAPSAEGQAGSAPSPTVAPGQELAFACMQAPKALAIMQDTALPDRDRRIQGLRQLKPATDALATAQTDDPAVLGLLLALAQVQSGLASGELQIDRLTMALDQSC